MAAAPSRLFSALKLRGVTLPSRIAMSPMCQYSCEQHDGVPTLDWHYTHYTSRAVGKVPLIIAEATGVAPEGRITPYCTGLWNEEQVAAWKTITDSIKRHGSVPAIQFAHAGRKASCDKPWRGGAQLALAAGGWETVAPSAVPFLATERAPRAMTRDDIKAVVAAFARSATLSAAAGFEVVEIHAAHGYLLHQFLSPLSNKRTDEYGGSFENRCRAVVEVAAAVRAVWDESKPLFVRISATDWMEAAVPKGESWDLEQSVELSKKLKAEGVDLIDVSSGALVPEAKIKVGPGYQVPFASAIREQAGIATGAVGMITDAAQAEEIIAAGQADLVLLARALLRDPQWPLRAAHALRVGAQRWPEQYQFAKVAAGRPF